jgi:uracil-DNA glycosylase
MDGEATQQNHEETAAALKAFADSMIDCTKCRLCENRTQVVFGVGSPNAELLFVGEGPGFHEDRQGEPFVGAAGKLLNELLGGIGLSRADVYIANVVKCRPPENRDPAPDEIEACSPHLMQQIAIIRPRVICTLGRFATKLLAETELSITAIHGKAKERTLAGVHTVLFPVFHPAAALYTPANRQVLVEDFARLRRLLDRGVEALSRPADPAECPAPAPSLSSSAALPQPALQQPPEQGAGQAEQQAKRVELTRTEQLHLW